MAPISPALRGYALRILIGITALSLTACGASNTSQQPAASGTGSTTAPTTSGSSPGPKVAGKSRAMGLITAVTGSTLAVSGKNGTATVGFSSATKISEVTPAALTDVTVGSCVSVRPARGTSPAPNGSVTAAAVLLSASKDGQCFTGARKAAGSPTAAPSGTPARHGLRGTVSSVGGNTLVVTTADGTASPTTVDLSDTTTYAKRTPAGVQAIAQGKCVTAQGNTDSSGTLQAEVIGLRPANNGNCPSTGH